MDACLAKLMCDCKLKDFINGDRLAEAVDQRQVIIIFSGHSGGRGTGSGTDCFRCKTDGQCKVHDDIGPVVATLGQIASD